MALLREIRLNWQPSRMTSAPLAMVMCDHSVSDAALGISVARDRDGCAEFFHGMLVLRLGLRTVMATGLTLILTAAAMNLVGAALWNFWIALLLLGVG